MRFNSVREIYIQFFGDDPGVTYEDFVGLWFSLTESERICYRLGPIERWRTVQCLGGSPKQFNTSSVLRSHFSSLGNPVTWDEFREFWVSLTVKERHYYRTTEVSS